MNKKKVILFMTTMYTGGIENALIELLNKLDYEKYDECMDYYDCSSWVIHCLAHTGI